jgi:hypothetical protein
VNTLQDRPQLVVRLLFLRVEIETNLRRPLRRMSPGPEQERRKRGAAATIVCK